jgi:hypothetical protein
VKYWKTTLAALAALSASLALADDFKTIDGKEYKNVTVSRVEPDGIMLKSKSEISKVYFVKLPKAVQSGRPKNFSGERIFHLRSGRKLVDIDVT